MKFNVLSSTLEGTDEPAYYNSRVGGKFYRPVESYQDPEYLKKLSQSMNTPEYKNKKSKKTKKQWADPEGRKKLESKTWGNPEYREKQLIDLKKNRHVHTKKDPITGKFIK